MSSNGTATAGKRGADEISKAEGDDDAGFQPPLDAHSKVAKGEELQQSSLSQKEHCFWTSHSPVEAGTCGSQQLVVKVLSDRSGAHAAGVGARLWGASRLLAQLLLRPLPLGSPWAELLSGKNPRSLRVLELGAGTALPSICLACQGHNVVATDLAEVIAVSRENLEANRAKMRGQAEAKCLAFGDPAAHALGDFDLVIGSDIAYDPASFDPLLQTLRMIQGPWRALLAVSDRAEDLGEETFENFCRDEGIVLTCRYTGLEGGTENHRINMYELDAGSVRRIDE